MHLKTDVFTNPLFIRSTIQLPFCHTIPYLFQLKSTLQLMEGLLVSILIPFKNTEAFLPECIDSIIDQKYQNWEILAVDDHSIDQSRMLMGSYADKDPRIKVFSNIGEGIIDALRLAYKNSKGQLITRMDSDDIMTPNKIKQMVTALVHFGKSHLAIGQVHYFSEQGISDGYNRYEAWLNKLTVNGNNYAEIYKECTIPSPCWMIHREDLDNCNAFRSNRYPEDYDLAFRFYENAMKCIPCDEVLHLWRDYSARTSRTSEHYVQNYFLDIKLHYFLKLDYDQKKPLVLWGAGNKGKSIAKGLLKEKINFHWLCDNQKKIGKEIYGKNMLHYSFIEELDRPQTIITVANDTEQAKIREYLSTLPHYQKNRSFFFC